MASGLGAAVLFGVSTPFAKMLVPSSGPFMLAGLLYLGAGVGLTPLLDFRRAGLEALFTIGLAVLVLGGVLLVAGPGEGGTPVVGVLAVAGACLAWSFDNNLSQRPSLRDPVAVTRVKALVAGGLNVALALAIGDTASRRPARSRPCSR